MRDMKKTLVLMSVGVFLLLVPAPILAHHGTRVSYDTTTSVTVEGVVTGFRYINPHPALFIDVMDEEGKTTSWTIEIAPTPYSLALNGWGRRRTVEAFEPGTALTVTMSVSRAGTPSSLLVSAFNKEGLEILGDE
jgi:hypothetical protein